MNTEVDGLRQSLDAALGQIDALQAKIAYLQRGRCGYCSWGDDEEKTFEELQAHIQECPLHPLAKSKQQIADLLAKLDQVPPLEYIAALADKVDALQAKLEAALDSRGKWKVLFEKVHDERDTLKATLEAAHADVRALALSALDYLDHAHRDSDNLRNDLARPTVRKLLEEQP